MQSDTALTGHSMINGSFPETLRYIFPKDEADDSAFVTADGNKKTEETGRYWANNRAAILAYQKKIPNLGIEELVVPNTPLDATIKSLEIRGEGGRAYKVYIEIAGRDFMVDLREDTLMEVIKYYGIKPGGILDCKLVWARIGSSMKLVVDGGTIHLELLATQKLTKIKNADMQIGYEYQTKSGQPEILLSKTPAGLLMASYYDYRDSENPTIHFYPKLVKQSGYLKELGPSKVPVPDIAELKATASRCYSNSQQPCSYRYCSRCVYTKAGY